MKNLRHIAFRAFIGLLFVGAIVSSSPAQAASGFSNPLLPRRADPYVYLHTDGNYYFCATVPEYDRIELARARDLAGLRTATPVVVWRKQKRLLVEDRNLWAPELHYLDGKWFIYYAAGTSLDPYDVRIRVIENDSADPMTGGWNDKGRLATGRDTLSLDATVFELGGSRYLLWAQRLTASDKSSMDLYIAKMKDPLTLAGKPAMIGRASESWEMRDPANLKMQGPASSSATAASSFPTRATPPTPATASAYRGASGRRSPRSGLLEEASRPGPGKRHGRGHLRPRPQ